MSGGPVNHCFPLSGDPNMIALDGFNNLLNAYTYALSNVELSGPTLFSPILEAAFIQAAKLRGTLNYQILLILTDGEIHDMTKTKDLLVRNAQLPLSLLIVGIGDADFDNMKQLDGDQGLIDSQGRRSTRDFVQFASFRQHGHDANELCRQLLKEIPQQVIKCMGMQRL